MQGQRSWRQRHVVHFNCLKPCHTPADQDTDRAEEISEPKQAELDQSNGEEQDTMTLIWQPPNRELVSESGGPAEHGG